MERRELMKMMAASVGGTMAFPESAFAKMGEPFDPQELTFFRPSQREQVAMIAEAIIPETDTPGAIEAGVPGWIEVIVKDCYTEEDQQIIIDGLADTMRRCQKEHGKDISQLTGEEQVAFLNKMNRETMEEARKAKGPKKKTFLQLFKDLTKYCYGNSEVGATQAFEFVFVPGKWVPSMPLEPGQKVWAM
ncbi:MAG: gluconate 2-dehydrogenase subunit 3 family protein [Akkermansiaceae bacterium]